MLPFAHTLLYLYEQNLHIYEFIMHCNKNNSTKGKKENLTKQTYNFEFTFT